MKNLVIALVTLTSLCTACANHVRFVDVKDDIRAKSVAESRVVIEPRADVLDTERVALRFAREDRVDARDRTTVTKIDEFTPYSVAHELYEVPVGLVSIPLSLVFNAVDGVLLGWVPNKLVDGYTYWTFAALNPFMNAESDARIDHREVGKVQKDGDAREELVSTPLRDVEVGVQLDELPPVRLRTDATGSVSIDLLELAAASYGSVRKVTIAIPAADARPAFSQGMYVGRELSERLIAASTHVRTLEESSASASALAEAVQMLDRLGFRAQSLRLEDEVRARFTSRPQDLAEFRDALAMHSSTLDVDTSALISN